VAYRQFLTENGFTEFQAPKLVGGDAEGGAEVFKVKYFKGVEASLATSPQLYKQIMAGVFERVFAVGPTFRAEKSATTRHLSEISMMDLEMAFIKDHTDVIALVTPLMRAITNRINEKCTNELKTLGVEIALAPVPFPRMTYKEAMEKYGNDRPDIREDKNDPNLLAFLWITDFPAFEKTSEDNVDGTGEWTFTHNPFAKPKTEYAEDFLAKKNIGDIISTQYDITLNGYEIGGGSIRNHNSVWQKNTFEIMGYDENRIQENFGHMLTALQFGAPPHGGIAWGFDRLIMLLENEPNIREVIPFAKTGEGKDLMMEAPAKVSEKQLKELGIKF
jgi:aspartyl-tRNA synthetase